MAHTLRSVPDSLLNDLHSPLLATRRPRLSLSVGWDRGTDADFLAELIRFWRDDYDWRMHEARILDLPWVETGSGDKALRVIHKRATTPDAPVVVLLHGWPDSVLRFERMLPLLEDVHVIVPALPGFPFAYELTRPGMTVARMASLVVDMMQTMGYERYVVSAGDVGADVAEQLVSQHANRVRRAAHDEYLAFARGICGPRGV